MIGHRHAPVLECDWQGSSGGRCSAQFGGDVIGETADEIRKRAKEKGWTRRRDRARMLDLCPEDSQARSKHDVPTEDVSWAH